MSRQFTTMNKQLYFLEYAALITYMIENGVSDSHMVNYTALSLNKGDEWIFMFMFTALSAVIFKIIILYGFQVLQRLISPN